MSSTHTHSQSYIVILVVGYENVLRAELLSASVLKRISVVFVVAGRISESCQLSSMADEIVETTRPLEVEGTTFLSSSWAFDIA